MNYTFLLEQGEESSAECFSDIPASVLSRLSLTAEKSCSRDSETESCHASRSGMTCEHSTEMRGGEKSMSSAVDFHARTSALLVEKQESKDRDQGYGERWPESLAKLDPASSLWKTRQRLLLEDSTECLQTFPDWGSQRDGECWEALAPACVQTESGFGDSLQGPTASDSLDPRFRLKSVLRPHHPNGNLKESFAQRFQKRITPESTEILNDWPEGWTDLKPLETAKFQQWLDSHGKPSRKD